jgi:predicted DNA repair protein MutK
MHIVALAWIYVVLMMAITEQSVVAGIMTFLLYGLVPLVVILYLMGTSQRRRKKRFEAEQLQRNFPSPYGTPQSPEADDKSQNN